MPFDAAPPPAPPPAVEEVVVRAARLPPPPGEAAFSVVRLDEGALEGARRLDEALGEAAGAGLFRRNPSLHANPTTQGLTLRALTPSGAGRALVTLDGAPQNDPFGGWVIWAALPPESLSGALVVRGAGAGPWGAGALTGTVALEERPALDPGLVADVSAGGLGARRGAAAASAPAFGGGLFASVYGERSDGYVPVRAGRGAADAPLWVEALSGALRWDRPVGPAVAAVRLGAWDERRGSGLEGAEARARGRALSLSAAAPPAPDRLGWRLQAWTRESDLYNSAVALAADRGSAVPASVQDETPARGSGLNAALRGRARGLVWEVGGDLRRARGETRERFRFQNGAFTRGRTAGGETSVAGAYVEGTARRGAWLLTGGLRADRWTSAEAVRRETDLATGEVLLDDAAPDRSGWAPTARAAARVETGDGRFLRAAAYAGFRPPTLNELHRPFRVGADVTEANAALEPERLHGVEVGGGTEGRRLSWSATLFFNRLDDPVTNVTVAAGPGTFPRAGFVPAGGVLRERRNAGRIDATGLELDAAFRAGEDLSLFLSAAFTRARVDGGSAAPQLTGLRPAQTPEGVLAARAEWRVAPRLDLSARLRLEGERFEDDLNTRRLSPAARLDLEGGLRLTEAARLYLAAENLLDAAIETGETATGVESFAAPRVVRLGVRVRL